MPLMTPEQYEESLRKMNFKVYLQGELVENTVDHPIIRPSLNSVKATYALAQDPQHQDLMTATSHLTGQKVNRFTHLHRSTEDLVKKVKMQRLLGQATASCFQRCVGMDAVNALDSTTFEMDQKLGTHYHERFEKFLRAMQENDWTVDGAMTDAKGDRSLAPSKQADPDLYLHVVERRADGIVVKGCKAHQTGALNSHQILVMPTISMGPGDDDYAVSFAIPADTDGILYIYGRQSCDTRKLEGGDIDVGNPTYGGHEALVVFENVFVPWERVFMCGECEFSGMLVERFAGYHRQSYGGCKVGVGDVLIGASALAAEYNGAQKASHVKDKLIEMTHLNETLYACGISCSCEGHKTASGTYLINLLLANVCKQNITRFPYEIARLAEDIAGGLMVTMPSEKDLKNPELSNVLEKYLSGVSSVPTEHRMRILRLIENITLGTAAVGYRTESMHGAGSPQAQRIMIARQGNLNGKKELAKTIAGIPPEASPEKDAKDIKKKKELSPAK
ncbi:4-hydroxybutyryl-CoA dehydratase [Brenneria goodwinii]|uniref:4-hydroxybutanoyl-CoA dehydratase / Vinylacetyl-CoA Delta-isomerase n=1 Tax=Brenneria goodwinii TaxID=1109412 RepID=A0A0G4JYE5_9GAMM|nr:4-hydroxyphenylacetate 3-hydroxylase family protein [Brenneria goodwinii]ATA23364.1 4-hydroxybutyryl-CoA dehydratase [Brenneria goodwinii]MCG8157227.1 4-hydroxyphenylacetate 3-hydroxylase family protein [Brenneria goodwinii]MCG8162181.1 4-hydroxyphenylacetate 3-hydroxylase family protein [Brenneria goodwinii]MCG8166111.1 4-hydroxyphenylacetate 3-hydroxylase family protein [Brenneria goodwinii]MCG8170738.1 4-hydroxyphenylacetate 3-hydroxylase family protein [Brenneria goodwinii]